MRIAMKEGDRDLLAGAIPGRRAFARLLEQTAIKSPAPEVVFLDFDGIEIATASFLRESVLAFRDAIRARRSNFYPVVANANEMIVEELKVLTATTSDVLMICNLDSYGHPHQPRLIGELDPKQRLTFNLVQQRGETDAAELWRESGEQGGVKQTAWNNRLASLASLGLIVELSEGRSKRYRVLIPEE